MGEMMVMTVRLNKSENTWNHFDVNHDGLVEVERMP
jgi:Ca2+-binding EF-hand superfamily protein